MVESSNCIKGCFQSKLNEAVFSLRSILVSVLSTVNSLDKSINVQIFLRELLTDIEKFRKKDIYVCELHREQ